MEAEEALDRILMPQSIAVIGASKNPFKWGNMMLTSIIKSGFEGKIYPINPEETEIEGLTCYSTVKDAPGNVDMAIVVVPAKEVPSIFRDLVEKRVKGAVVISSGFGETGSDGEQFINEIKEESEGRLRFIGPNCMGVCSSPINLSALMIPFLHEGGEVAFVSQSGGYGLQLYLKASTMGVGISKFISSGNESDITSVDYLKYFGRDPSINLICMYIEGLKRGREWYEVAKDVTKNKPVVVIKVGTTEEGGKAAASHTGAMSGRDSIYEAAFKQSGVIRARDALEMFDFSKGLLYAPPLLGNQIGVISNSGGIAVETADALIKNGLKVPPLNEEAQAQIMNIIPSFGNSSNPVDLTATLNVDSFLRVPEIVLSQSNIHGLITIGLSTSIMNTMFQESNPEDLMGIYKVINEYLLKTYNQFEKPVIVINPAKDLEPEAAKIMEEAKIPVYTTPERAAEVMGVLYRRKVYLDKARNE